MAIDITLTSARVFLNWKSIIYLTRYRDWYLQLVWATTD